MGGGGDTLKKKQSRNIIDNFTIEEEDAEDESRESREQVKGRPHLSDVSAQFGGANN